MKKILFYGDSNTYGYDPRAFSGGRYPAEERWTVILQDMLKNVCHIAVDGMNGRKVPDVSGDMSYLEGVLLREAPLDLFVCMLGTNDILLTPNPDAAVPAEKMERFLGWIRMRTGPETIMLLIAPPLIGETADVYYKNFHAESQVMNQLLRETALRCHAEFADAALWDIGLAYDQVHFSPEGCRRFAEHMKTRILEIPGFREPAE